ncbi:MAG TPA: hypothetical protein VNO52_09185, partial [Methylomirabilota bacterium]|nr:hypothetical protein [Methylomirabilota bacterium]
MRAIAYGCIRAVGLLPGVFAACGAVAPGEVAPTDVITPVPLVVVDPARTEAWRRQERERLPAVWRSDPEAAGRALNRLAELFAGARGDFVSEVASAFSKPVLEVAELNSPLFRQALLAFEQRHQQFPLSLELARLWALGASGDVVLDDWMEMLRRAVVAPMAADNDQVGDPT